MNHFKLFYILTQKVNFIQSTKGVIDIEWMKNENNYSRLFFLFVFLRHRMRKAPKSGTLGHYWLQSQPIGTYRS